MTKFGTLLQEARDRLKLTNQTVSKNTGIDAGVVSKIENGKRLATRKQVLLFIDIYKLNEEKVFTAWLSDKVLEYIKDEEYALNALMVAEEEIKYNSSTIKADTLSSELKRLIDRVDELKKKWNTCKPLDETQLRKMKEHFDVTYTFDSNQIEGNTLTYQETHLVVNEGMTVGGKSMREHLEAINHYEAIDFITDVAQKKEAINERLLKEIHYLILKGIDRVNAGVYRSVPVLIGGSIHKPPEPYLLDKKMEEIFEFYLENKNKLHPVILAADMHEKIVAVHPFIDSNGRTSRLIMNLILISNGFTIASLKGDYDARMNYYKALENVQIQDKPDNFYKLILQTCIDSLNDHIKLAG